MTHKISDENHIGNIVYGSTAIEIEVFSGINIQINTNASSTFGDALKSDGSIQKIIDALENNDLQYWQFIR